jgi:hypothetical protein
VQVPTARRVTENPETVHTLVVRDVTVTVSPDEAVGAMVSGDAARVVSEIDAKVMSWFALVIVKVPAAYEIA